MEFKKDSSPKPAQTKVVTKKAPVSNTVLYSFGTLLAVAIVVVFVIYFVFVGPRPNRTTDWQAVFLTNGQFYFGHIEKENNRDVYLSEVYYLESSNPLQQDGQPTPRGELSLVKLGNELHGPVDTMILNRDHVLFTEDLRDDGKVVQAIMRHQAGQKEETNKQ